MRWVLALVLMALLCLFGCYGLQTRESCEGILNPEQLMECYRSAGNAYAYAGNYVAVGNTCDAIEDIGKDYGGDLEKRGRIERDLCLYESAKILATNEKVNLSSAEAMCYRISAPPGEGLFGAPVTRDMCTEQVDRLGATRPDEYYNNPDNICANVVFVFPLLALLAFKLVHEL